MGSMRREEVFFRSFLIMVFRICVCSVVSCFWFNRNGVRVFFSRRWWVVRRVVTVVIIVIFRLFLFREGMKEILYLGVRNIIVFCRMLRNLYRYILGLFWFDIWF